MEENKKKSLGTITDEQTGATWNMLSTCVCAFSCGVRVAVSKTDKSSYHLMVKQKDKESDIMLTKEQLSALLYTATEFLEQEKEDLFDFIGLSYNKETVQLYKNVERMENEE